MKFKDYLLIGLIIALVALSLFTCNNQGAADLLEEKVEQLDDENKALEKAVEVYQDSVDQSKKKIAEIRAQKDTVIKYRTIDRQASSNRIRDARNATEKEADSILSTLFDSSVDNLVQVREHDSLKLEMRSLTDLFNKEEQENLELGDMNRYLQEQINLKDSIISNKDSQLVVKDDLIKLEKKKGNKKLFIGGGIGFSFAAMLYLFAGGN